MLQAVGERHTDAAGGVVIAGAGAADRGAAGGFAQALRLRAGAIASIAITSAMRGLAKP